MPGLPLHCPAAPTPDKHRANCTDNLASPPPIPYKLQQDVTSIQNSSGSLLSCFPWWLVGREMSLTALAITCSFLQQHPRSPVVESFEAPGHEEQEMSLIKNKGSSLKEKETDPLWSFLGKAFSRCLAAKTDNQELPCPLCLTACILVSVTSYWLLASFPKLDLCKIRKNMVFCFFSPLTSFLTHVKWSFPLQQEWQEENLQKITLLFTLPSCPSHDLVFVTHRFLWSGNSLTGMLKQFYH